MLFTIAKNTRTIQMNVIMLMIIVVVATAKVGNVFDIFPLCRSFYQRVISYQAKSQC